jgi:hypothetical protein
MKAPTDYDIAFAVLDNWHQQAIDFAPLRLTEPRNRCIDAIVSVKQALYDLLKR